jgi:hypothetical protein
MASKWKKLISCVIIAAVLICLPWQPVRADSSGLIYTAVNDHVCELSEMPYVLDGSRYLSFAFFYTHFKISWEYFSGANSITMSKGTELLIFDLDNGTCRKRDGQDYPAKAILSNGVYYVSARIGALFGLNYSTLTGNGYGDLFRITDGSQILNNAQFMDAVQAAGHLERLYAAYYNSIAPPVISDPGESPTLDDAEVYISFIGLPSPELLDVLKSQSTCAAFFLTAGEIRDNTDLVRRTIIDGHTVGVYYEDKQGAEDAALALVQCAMYRPTIVASPESQLDSAKAYAEECGCVYYLPQHVIPPETAEMSAVTQLLATDGQACDFLLTGGEDSPELLQNLLYFLSLNGYSPLPLLEINTNR